MSKKILYFEGAGWEDADSSKATDVGNCRIRTAFTNNDGKKIYLEIIQGQKFKKNKKEPDYFYIVVDFCHYITPDKDDCNESRIRIGRTDMSGIEYTKGNILKLINEKLNCSFEEWKYYRGFLVITSIPKQKTDVENVFLWMISQIYRKEQQNVAEFIMRLQRNTSMIFTRSM